MGGSLSRGVSVRGGLCHGTVEEKAVHILLECILVLQVFLVGHFRYRYVCT